MTPKPLHSGAALSCLLAAAAAIALLGCGCGAAQRRAAGRAGHGGVDPGACGTPAGDLGRRMQTFLQATIALEAELASTDAALHATCAVMAQRLGLPGQPARARRTSRPRTLPLCTAVAEELRARLGADPGASPGAAATTPASTPTAPASAPAAAPAPAASSPIVVRAAPAACTVRMDVAAQAAAACSTDEVALLCRGTCQGTCTSDCQGTCEGRCEGRCQSTDRDGARTDGTCNGLCQGACTGTCAGTCDGTCEGTCSGHVDVMYGRDARAARGEAACEVGAELAASAAAVCTAPAIEIALGPGTDAARLGAALRTMREDLAIVLRLRARLAGPLQAAMLTWARVATDLVAAGPGALRPLGGQATCVFDQLEAAAARLAAMQASLSEQLAAAAALEAAVRLERS